MAIMPSEKPGPITIAWAITWAYILYRTFSLKCMGVFIDSDRSCHFYMGCKVVQERFQNFFSCRGGGGARVFEIHFLHVPWDYFVCPHLPPKLLLQLCVVVILLHMEMLHRILNLKLYHSLSGYFHLFVSLGTAHTRLWSCLLRNKSKSKLGRYKI